MTEENIAMLRDIFKLMIDKSRTPEEYDTSCTARDLVEYALANNIFELKAYKRYYESSL